MCHYRQLNKFVLFAWYARWAKDLAITLPEMVFGDSKIEIWNENLGVRFEYTAFDALSQCKHESDIKVSMAQTWKAKSGVEVPSGQSFEYDWTYGSKYRGTFAVDSVEKVQVLGPTVTEDRIDFESLKVRLEFGRYVLCGYSPGLCSQPRAGDEILWSAETVLYEDELHDNGTSQLSVRIRVTNNYFYVLQRVWIRVDGVIFRLKESRLLHRFSESHVLRLSTDREDAYENVVKSCTAKQLRESILDDPNLISDKLKLKFEITEKFLFSGENVMKPVLLQTLDQKAKKIESSDTKDEIERQNAAAEAAFKKKFGNAKPNAAALMQRQRQHETRYFDSGDAFSSKEKGGS